MAKNRNPGGFMSFRFSHMSFSFAAFLLAGGMILWVAPAMAQQYYGTPPAGARQPAPAPQPPYQPAPAGTTYPNTGAPVYTPQPATGAPVYTPQPTTAPPVGSPQPGTTAPATTAPEQVQVRQAPFQLTADQQREVDLILAHWEKFSLAVNHFQTGFHRFRTVTAFDDDNKQETINEKGELRYQSPDCGMFAVTDMQGRPIEKWLCDGASVYEYQYGQKKIQQHLLPENMRGKGITQGPLPFLFGASAQTLKNRYFIRRMAVPVNAKAVAGQVWIEVFPRTIDDAQDFRKAEMIISLTPEVRPFAIRLYKANNETHSYVFDQKNMKVNPRQLMQPSWKPTREEMRDMQLEQDTGR